MEQPRHFENPYSDYNSSELGAGSGGKSGGTSLSRSEIDKFIKKMMLKLDEGVENGGIDGEKVYTGISGLSLFYLLLGDKYETDHADRHYRKALEYIQTPLRHLRGQKFSFLCGDAGPLAIGAVVYHKLGMVKESRDCVKRLDSLSPHVVDSDGIPDECLFGRSGYLYALMFVRDYLGPSSISPTTIDKVCEAILQSGCRVSTEVKSSSPLMYQWHGKYYIGAAHGLSGIYTLLLQSGAVSVDAMLDKVKLSIDHVVGMVYNSGNFPSSVSSSSNDKLIHWCHGAPGVVHMLVQAYKKFDDKVYMEAALRCGEVIWGRGLLCKGYGLCHGVAGNGYAFLTLYQLTNDDKHLYRANRFAEWCLNYGCHGCRAPDSPYSLYEGLAGTMYYIVDILDPNTARFPAFSLKTS